MHTQTVISLWMVSFLSRWSGSMVPQINLKKMEQVNCDCLDSEWQNDPSRYCQYILICHVFLPTAVNQLKEKMQELSMYRSLLLQQISTIKLLCTNKEDNQVIYKKYM